MARYIGSIACLSLLIAGWWMLGADHTPIPELSAQSVVPDSGSATGPSAAPLAGTLGGLDHQRALAANWPRLSFGRRRTETETGGSAETEEKAAAYRETARRLLGDAKTLARRGDFAGALRLVDRAASFPVRWSEGEESPQVVREQIERMRRSSANGVDAFLNSGDAVPAGVAAGAAVQASGSAESPPAQVARLMTDARRALHLGMLEQAEQLARAAQRVAQQAGLRFAPGQETPERLLQQIAAKRTEASRSIVPVAAEEQPMPAGAAGGEEPAEVARRKQMAQRLLAEAREDIRNNRLGSARSKAQQAQRLNVPFGLFDNRPEHVLADIARLEAQGRAAAGATVADTTAELPTIQPAERQATTVATSPADQTPAQTTSVGVPGALSPKEQAKLLLRQAREALRAGRFEEARRGALEAQKLNVEYDLFEDRPEHILAEIARRGGELIIPAEAKPASGEVPVRLAAKPQADDATNANTSDRLREKALQLLAEAREAIKAKRWDVARQKALQAQQLGDVAYRLFDDRPELVLADVKRLQAAELVAKRPPVAPAETPQPTAAVADASSGPQDPRAADREKARTLLRQARAALKAGRLDEATRLAQQAQAMQLSYGLFDDRPDLVLADIRRAAAEAAPQVAQADAAPQAGREPAPAPRSAAPIPEPLTPEPVNAAAKPPAQAGDPLAELERESQRQQQLQANRRQALQWLRQARAALRAGDVNTAEDLARKAQQLEVAYGVLDDRPERVLAEIEQRRKGAADQQVAQNSPTQENRRQALALLKQAREALNRGDLQTALQKAKQAQQLEVVYGVLDDRPDLVLADIGRIQRQRTTQLADANAEQQAKRERAIQLLAEARADLAAGRIADAERKVAEAEKLDVAYRVWDDRPELVRRDIQLAKKAQPRPVQIARDDHAVEPGRGAELPLVPPAEPRGRGVNEPRPLPEMPSVAASSDAGSGKTPAEEIAPIAPQGVSALDLYNQGIAALRRGDQVAAYKAFLAAYQSGQRLDPYRAQQLQDYLRELAPKAGVQLASGTSDATDRPSQLLNEAEQRRQLQLDRLRSDVLDAIFRAERLRDEDPERALQILDRALASVESATLDPSLTAGLVASLRNARASVQSHMQMREPIQKLLAENEETRERIKSDIATRIRIEQEFAKLVDEYNRLMRQKRYAEAEKIAKQAKELDPNNPVTETMKWKARIARRVDFNEELRDRKEDAFVRSLAEVEESAVPFWGPPMQFPDDWEELTNRRRARYRTDSRFRTDKEKKIEDSLSRPVSLHFTEAPLQEVIEHLASVADIDIVVDQLGLQDEGVTTNTPVTINVDGIMLKSALNLILEPLNLAYTIKDEVLHISSELRQQGELITVTYPVADLVIPVPNLAQEGTLMNGQEGPSAGLLTNANINRGLAAAAQFQVAGAGPAAAAIPQWNGGANVSAQLNGGGSSVDFDTLSELIVSTVAPNTWEEVGGEGSIRGFETTLSLVIRQTRKVHDEIKDLLEQLRRLQDLQVTIEVRFVTVSDRFFERIGIDFDFDVQDTVGGPDRDAFGNPLPPFGTPLIGLGQTGNQQGQQGQRGQVGNQQGQAGGIGGGTGMGPVGFGFLGAPLGGIQPAMNGMLGFGGIGGIAGIGGGIAGQAGQRGQVGQRGQAGQLGQVGQVGITGFFTPGPPRELTDRDDFPHSGTIVGLSAPGMFTPDLDIQFRQGSFEIGIPDFGGFDPNAGIQVGLAILSDIETFFFIQAAQGDSRSNIMFAPKVTMFNGQTATVTSTRQRPFVTSLVPTVGAFAVGFTPNITVLNEGVFMTVTAVISADRRFVRLTVVPNFTQITDVFTFFITGGGGGIGGGGVGGAAGGIRGAGGVGGGIAGVGGGIGGLGGGGIGGFGGGLGGVQGGVAGGVLGLGGIGGGPAMSIPTRDFGFGGAIPARSVSQSGMLGFGGIGGIAGFGGGIGGGGIGGVGGGIGGIGGIGGGGIGGFNAPGAGPTAIQQPVQEIVNVTTTVSVPDGGTVLLGGIKALQEGRNMSGVPILNKIPYVSRLFKNSGVGREARSLMLMVTPRIIIMEEEEELLGLEL